MSIIRKEWARRKAEADRAELHKNAAAIRERCKTLMGFVAEFWSILEPGRPFVDGWAIQAVAKHLEAVTDGKIQYLLINVPPGMMKSLLVSVFWPAWEWGPRSLNTLGFLTSSFGLENVLRDNDKMRKLVESDKYQLLYGDLVQPGTKWGERRFANRATGVRAGRSFEKMTGGRGDRVIIDDPHDVNGAESDTQRGSVVKTFREAIPDRLNDMSKSSIVVIMQRLHANDVAGTILQIGLPYVHLNLPMEFESTKKVDGVEVDARCRTYDRNGNLFFEDPRTYDGELLFPERFPAEVIAGLKVAKGSYAYSGQYQQRPTAREGGLFKRAWFAGKIVASTPASARVRVRAWDRAGTKAIPGKSPDWSAGVRMARDGNDYYIEHVARDQDSPGNIRKLMLALAESDPRGTTMRIPKEPSQAGIDQAERDVEAFAGHPVVIRPISGDKEVRATPLSISAEYGFVYLVNGGPIDGPKAPWIEAFLDELCAFPNGANDDQVDAAADAHTELAGANFAPFDFASSGSRLTSGPPERDSRYNFGDMGNGQPVRRQDLGFGIGNL